MFSFSSSSAFELNFFDSFYHGGWVYFTCWVLLWYCFLFTRTTFIWDWNKSIVPIQRTPKATESGVTRHETASGRSYIKELSSDRRSICNCLFLLLALQHQTTAVCEKWWWISFSSSLWGWRTCWKGCDEKEDRHSSPWYLAVSFLMK